MNRTASSSDQNKEYDTNISQQSRTSFLIEDILYRQQNADKEDNNLLSKNYDPSSSPSVSYNKIKYDCGEKVFQTPNNNKIVDKRPSDKSSGYGYFQPTNLVQNGGCVQSFQQTDNGYIQVMGALGAYLGTPYKTITDPYFLAQGKTKPISIKSINTISFFCLRFLLTFFQVCLFIMLFLGTQPLKYL